MTDGKGLGQIAVLIVIGILIALGGMLGGPEAFFNKEEVKIPSPEDSYYVYDAARVLHSSTEDYIISKNVSLEEQTGAQIVVACVSTTGKLEIEEYAKEMFGKWHIGDEKLQNGVLILMAVDDADYYMLQGEGIKSSLPASRIKVILTDYMEPDFAESNYDLAAKTTFDALIEHFEAAYGITAEESDSRAVLEGSYEGGGGESISGISISREDIVQLGTFMIKSAMNVLKIAILAFLLISLLVIFIIIIVMKVKGKKVAIDEMVEPKSAPKANVNPYSAARKKKEE